VIALLGEDVMLWGASLQSRAAENFIRGTPDIESCHPDAKTVSVWISIEHTTRDVGDDGNPGLAPAGVSIQEMRHRCGKDREKHSGRGRARLGEGARRWVQAPNSSRWRWTPGDALFFDEAAVARVAQHDPAHPARALLLQYATPEHADRIPDFNHLDWPFRQLEQPRPTCIMINGSDKTSGSSAAA
jgi:hypothetical protein